MGDNAADSDSDRFRDVVDNLQHVARFAVSMDGGPVAPVVIRLTHAYRFEDGAWKVVHEHSDFQPPDHETPPAIGSR